MGRGYSCNGYLNAILRRSEKTLLVEGVTDKAAMHRLLAESHVKPDRKINIDQAGIIEDEELRGLGNKEKIIYLRNTIANMLASHPKLGDVLSSLIDREWDGLEITIAGLSDEWSPPEQSPPHFVTTGHSIENYCLALEPVIAFLKLCFSEFLTGAFIAHLEANYSKMLSLAAAFSVFAKESSCIKRCGDLVSRSEVIYINNRYEFSPALARKLEVRGLDSPHQFIETINGAVEISWLSDELRVLAKWLMHGHLGSDVIWACVAHAATLFGMPDETAARIERGYQAERERFMFNWLSQNAQISERQPLDSAIEWLTA